MKTFYPTPEDYIPLEDTYEYSFRTRLEYFNEDYRKIICDTPSLRSKLMEDNYKQLLKDIITLKISL